MAYVSSLSRGNSDSLWNVFHHNFNVCRDTSGSVQVFIFSATFYFQWAETCHDQWNFLFSVGRWHIFHRSILFSSFAFIFIVLLYFHRCHLEWANGIFLILLTRQRSDLAVFASWNHGEMHRCEILAVFASWNHGGLANVGFFMVVSWVGKWPTFHRCQEADVGFFIVVSWQMQVDTFSVVSVFAFVFFSSAPRVPTLHLVSRLWLIGSLM